MPRFFKVCLVLLFLDGVLFAQTHVSVPVGDRIYAFLDMAELRGLIDDLPSTRPYTRKQVRSYLNEIALGDLSEKERMILDVFREQYEPVAEDADFYDLGGWFIRDETFPAVFGFYVDMEIGSQLTFTDDSALMSEFGAYLRGDLGSFLSYDAWLGALITYFPSETVFGIDPDWRLPHSFSKSWDGGLHGVDSLGAYRSMTDKPAFGTTMGGEIAGSFWEDRLLLRLGRIRHDWGYGEGSLYLDALARPFVGFEFTLRPWTWLDLSFLTGLLEYYVYPGQKHKNNWLQYVAATQQNAYTLLQLDARPTKWLTLSVWQAAIWPKRWELGYMVPFLMPFLYQNVIGDFDNLMFGGSLVLDWPGYVRGHVSLFVDEMDLNDKNFFQRDRNMYAFQVGARAWLPGLPWSRLVLQYTKIEPYTYTHPPTSTPWYGDVDNSEIPTPFDDNSPYNLPNAKYNMQTGYLNNGEPLGYHLPPNSQELLLRYQTRFHKLFDCYFLYKMITHGETDGSEFKDFIPYYNDAWKNDPIYHKEFLKDGRYRWSHVFALGADFDFQAFTYFPARFGVELAMAYNYQTDYKTRGDFTPQNKDFDVWVNFVVRIYPR